MLIKSPAVYLLAILCAMIVTPAQALVQRAFIASYGSDSNTALNCDVTHPCRYFSTAVTVVSPDGEVVVLDSGNYGLVTLTQSISLTAAPGVYAGMSVPSGRTGVTIATPGVNVVLRGLTINSQGGDVGVLMSAGAKLSIENCVISNFLVFNGQFQYGILVTTPAKVRIVNTLARDNDVGIQLEAGATADISESKFLGSYTAGIVAQNSIAGTTTVAAISNTVVSAGGVGIYAIADTASAAAKVDIIRSIVSNTATGISAESAVGRASVSIRKSMVTRSSTYGLSQKYNATLTSFGNNTLTNNSTANVAGTLTTAAPL